MQVLTWKLNAIQVLAFACAGAAIGVWIKKKLPVLDRLNIPAAIVGGMVYALLALVLRDRFLNLEMDLALRDILMVAFFTTIGMSASMRLIQQGGAQVLMFFGIALVGAVLQNVLGVGLAMAFGLDPLLGIVSGSMSLTGGPATALAFGATFEGMGVAGATTLGIACATFGITAGGLVGGNIGGWLIRRHRLQAARRPVGTAQPTAESLAYGETLEVLEAAPGGGESATEHSPLFRSVIAVAVAMGIGTVVSAWMGKLGLILPSYVGAMMAAAFLRYLDDRFGILGISQHLVDAIGSMSLYIFIVMALLTLRLWELVHLAAPMIVILTLQVALIWLLCVTVSYRLMGRDYDSAVMAGGYCGFMLGTTANAMACMDVLARKHGPAPRAFLVVPLVGAFLIDFGNALVITAMANFFQAGP